MPAGPAMQTDSRTATAPRRRDAATVSLEDLLQLARPAEALPLKAGSIRALQGGTYTAPFKGRGMEFDETRPYQPGDDIRNLDWKVTARTGKTHTKLFREERERPVLLWLDLRQPMFFATHGAFKSVIASEAAALLAWSAVAHRDRVGGLIFSEQSHRELRPQSGKTAALKFLKTLCLHPQWRQPPVPPQISFQDSARSALLRLHNVARPGSLIFLLSDFRGFTPELETHVASIARHNDLVLVHVADRLEYELPPAGRYTLRGDAREIRIDTGDARAREAHRQRFESHRAYLQALCLRYRMFYLQCGTGDNPVRVLQNGLGLKRR
ncbi:MAG TPA: DUF58 domain-containing protein [Gammaproteobacteria bacterium]|nr:DUF58 domain-containing protein [Gammaproteobacteria bacterium]